MASAFRIFVGNLAYSLMIGILSLFAGGLVKICVLFLFGFSFGHVANLYWQRVAPRICTARLSQNRT
ncbi:MAG: hypothetical protein C7B46_02860 [Sulfobacillus benefaciens]|uniref:Uncharacterized protein n=1 Tax=Sulfobacillus benefaciens TaxID=453960 RepID=A0A2T2XK52_9FIRM|nr:MAG: hypothetical protein C7B46_02860 [Sulfobacillus benefaciens]